MYCAQRRFHVAPTSVELLEECWVHFKNALIFFYASILILVPAISIFLAVSTEVREPVIDFAIRWITLGVFFMILHFSIYMRWWKLTQRTLQSLLLLTNLLCIGLILTSHLHICFVQHDAEHVLPAGWSSTLTRYIGMHIALVVVWNATNNDAQRVRVRTIIGGIHLVACAATLTQLDRSVLSIWPVLFAMEFMRIYTMYRFCCSRIIIWNQNHELNLQYAQLAIQRDQLREQRDQLQEQHDKLEFQHNQLKVQNHQLEVQRDELKLQNAVLRQQHDELEERRAYFHAMQNAYKNFVLTFCDAVVIISPYAKTAASEFEITEVYTQDEELKKSRTR